MKNFKIKTGDTSPAIELQLFPDDFDLTGKQVLFGMRNIKTGEIKVSQGVMTVTQPTNPPRASYQWLTGDTDEEGVFEVEVRVVSAGNHSETFPSERDKNVKVIIGQNIP